MKLETDRLSILELEEKHVRYIHQMHMIEDVARYNTIGIPKDVSETRSYIQAAIDDRKNDQRSAFGWIVKLKETNTFIGEMGMNLAARRFKMAEIHYSLMPDHWGNGYAIEAVTELINFGFNTLGLHRIQAGVATENVKSIKLLEKVGMQREGLKRKILPIRGEWKDNYFYAILDEDVRD